MRTLQQIKEYKRVALDGRDIHRLIEFLDEKDYELFGLELKQEYKGTVVPIPFTEQNVLEKLRKDLAFAFEKALGKRGLSAAMMFDVVKMCNWVLDNDLQDWSENDYAMYGLPLFKATAELYGFDNPIGEDTGREDKYEE